MENSMLEEFSRTAIFDKDRSYHSTMYCTQYKTLDAFKANVLPDLFELELDNSFLIGAVLKFPAEQDSSIMLAVHDPEITNKQGKPKATFAAFRSNKPFPLILASCVENHSDAVQMLFDFVHKENILPDITDFLGEAKITRDFMKLITNAGKQVYLFRGTSHYYLSEVDPGILSTVDKDVSDGSSSFGLITLEDHWTVDWGLGFYHDINETHIERDFIQLSHKRMIQNADMWKWMIREKDSFTPVAMTAKHRETPLTASIASVYTPPELRGKGYATRCVAAVCRHLLTNRGKKWVTLLADKENPVSNHVYVKVGFKVFQDTEHYRIKTSE